MVLLNQNERAGRYTRFFSSAQFYVCSTETSKQAWARSIALLLDDDGQVHITFSTDLSSAVAPGPAGAGANSALPRQSGTAALPSSAAPPGYAAGIPTSGLRQIPAGSPSRYPQDDADAPHQYRRGSDAVAIGMATR